jgi:4-hydroxyphenylpyruvate dioxygenase
MWSIATVCLGGTLEAKLQAATRAGFRAVEIFENDLTFFNGRPKDIRKMAQDLGLDIVALQPMRDFEGMPAPLRQLNMDRAERKFDLMQELGTELLCLCSTVAAEAADDPERVAADLAELADRAARRNFRIGYEALAWGRHTKDWMTAWEHVRRADRPNLGVVLDSFHACVRGNPLPPMADIPAEKIALVQIADAPAILMDPLSLSRHHRCMPGQGDWPMREYLRSVLATGYDGPVSLEIFNDQFRGASTAQVAMDGMRSLQWLAEQLAREPAPTPKAQAAYARMAALSPPPAPKVTGTEFIEFAADNADGAQLAEVLTGIGFIKIAKHRTKEVDLYRQGGVNLVVNRETEGFAHAFALMHGPSVCAIGLNVDKASVAVKRAKALGSETYAGRIGPGEAVMPALRGIEGSLVYLVEPGPNGKTVWDTDFVFDPGKAAPDGVERIDHLSNVVRRSEFLTWVLFHKALLGFEQEPTVELIDPYGGFFSRCLSSADGSVRIPVNIGEGGQSLVARFIDTFGGAGVQHVAFATDDIFALAEASLARGAKFLSIPDNYYDDIHARFGLDAELVGAMRDLNILYDRQGQGDDAAEFFQLYTSTFQDRLFFEVVERRGYRGLGAANTPVRLVAQARAQDKTPAWSRNG